MLNKKSVDDINVKGLKVLVRCDFNVPMVDGKITDENRLVAALPTIKKLIADGGKIILCSHLGKVKTEEELVSSDIIGIREGSLFDATQTMVTNMEDGNSQVQVVSWYDNENSYTSQMVRTIKYFAELA